MTSMRDVDWGRWDQLPAVIRLGRVTDGRLQQNFDWPFDGYDGWVICCKAITGMAMGLINLEAEGSKNGRTLRLYFFNIKREGTFWFDDFDPGNDISQQAHQNNPILSSELPSQLKVSLKADMNIRLQWHSINYWLGDPQKCHYKAGGDVCRIFVQCSTSPQQCLRLSGYCLRKI